MDGGKGRMDEASSEALERTGRTYTLQASTNLTSNIWIPVAMLGPVAMDGPVELSDIPLVG
jgi:hypothetical protein